MSSFQTKILDVVSDLSTQVNNPFKDKWVSILGDSISTYEGYIPEGNEFYYPKGDVTSVDKTWWHMLLTRLGAKLCVNESWSGREVCGSTTTENAMVNRANKLHRVAGQTYMNLDGTTEVATEDIQPDIILVLLGVNDFNDNKTLGTYETKYYTALAGNFYHDYNYMLMILLGNMYKTSQIYCLETTYSNIFRDFLKANSSGSQQVAYNEAINKEANLYGVNVIHTSRLGITAANPTNYLIGNLHPNAACMKMIANQCYTEMMASSCI